MKFLKYSLLLAAATLPIISCSKIVKIHTSKDNVTKQIEISEAFSSIETYSVADVEYTDGPASVTLIASPELAKTTQVFVKDGVLIVTQDEQSRNFNGGGKAVVKVSYPGIDTFKTLGTGDIEITSLNGKNVIMETAGTGDIECGSVKSTTLMASTHGTGNINLDKVDCTKADFSTNGTGDIEVKHITAQNVFAVTNGTGDITIAGECTYISSLNDGTGEIYTKGLKRK